MSTETKAPEQQRRDAEAYRELQKLIGEQALKVLLEGKEKPQPVRDQ
jgi:hypothetical protein